jgi:Tol biopolymer transport system component/DNA-binding winged helix-turn-helix (wHTH) protein
LSHETTVSARQPGTRAAEVFEVGPWRVEPLALSLSRGDGAVARVEPRVMSLLVNLARASGRTVTHEALIASVWEGASVTPDAVHGAVSKLRRVLEDGLGAGSAIETVPRVGYRLRLPVRLEDPPSPVAAAGAKLAEARGRRFAWAAAAIVTALAISGLLGARPRSPEPTGPAPPVVRPLTSFPGLEIEPAFAPTGPGDRIAFSWKGPAQQQWDIYTMVVGGGPPLQLTDDPAADRHPAWSPDASRIAFVRRSAGDCALLSVSALGGEERTLGACRDPADLAFAADGGTLYFSDRPAPDAPFRLNALDLSSGALRVPLEPAARGVGDHGIAPSPTGAGLALLRSPVLGVEDLWLLEPPAGPRRLTHDNLKIHGVDWLPDGRSLIVSSNRSGLFSLWRVFLDGREPAWLGVSGGDLDSPTVSGDGRRVAFEHWQEDTNLYRLDLADAAAPPRALGSSTRWDFQPALSPDGARLAFVSDRTGSSELWTGTGDGSSVSQRTRFGGAYVTSPQWSPDGGRIAFDVRAAGNGDLWLLDADADRPRRLTDTSASDLAPTWSRDGRSLLFASDRSGTWELWRLDLESSAARALTRAGGYRGLETARGIVVSRADRAGLWLLAPGDAVPRELVDDLAPVDRANWHAAGDTLVYVQRPVPERPRLVRLDLGTGARSVVGELRDFAHTSGVALAPDARWIAFSRVDRRESDVLWLELARP